MTKILYFDPFNGISGDMIVGALIGLGLPLEHLEAELAKLGLNEFKVSSREVERQGLFGVDFQVETKNRRPEARGHPREEATAAQGHRHKHSDSHSHSNHDHGGHGRGYGEIRRLIESSSLDPWVKEKSISIFRRLGEAEAKVHRTSLEKVHFHEVGAVDSIVDIVGACIGFAYFQAEEFYAGPVNLGFGTVRFSHGSWPVPAPATAELIGRLPAYPGETSAEMTTPTGAAVLAELVAPGLPLPPCLFRRSGFGAGDREFPEIPNMLRIMLGEKASPGAQPLVTSQDEVVQIEANLDDMDPRLLGHTLELALAQGALDAYCLPAYMKKNRPGSVICVLCRDADRERFVDLLLRETTTLGVRWGTLNRRMLDREIRSVETPFGRLKVKVGIHNGRIINAQPEFEDLRRRASDLGIPVKQVLQGVDWRRCALGDGEE